MHSYSFRRKIFMSTGLLMAGLFLQSPGSPAGAAKAASGLCAEDDRLKPAGHETYEYDGDRGIIGGCLYDEYRWADWSYEEDEIAESSHAYFDEQNRLTYALGYTPAILGSRSSYCEERIYRRDDTAHTCSYIYYKSNSMPYEDGFYIAYRYMFENCELQYDSEGRLLKGLTYRRNVGSDPNGYSEELFFDRGYEAVYDGERLMAELRYQDYWGTNETGAWEHRIYRYDEQGNCIQKVVTTEDEILLYCYEYQEAEGRADEYIYQVTAAWEFVCDDGSVYHFRPRWGKPAIRKTAADGSVEEVLYYGKAMDMGQQHFLMPEDVEETMDDHMYTVEPGDCLWSIAAKCYGHGRRYELILRMNREVIGWEEDRILPGMRLYIPEAGNAQNT